MEITNAIREYALDKMKSLEKFISDDVVNSQLTLELSKTTNHHSHGDVFQAEAKMPIRGKVITLRTTQDDLYKAVDILKDMLARELSSHKDKEISLVRRGAHKVKTMFKKIM